MSAQSPGLAALAFLAAATGANQNSHEHGTRIALMSPAHEIESPVDQLEGQR